MQVIGVQLDIVWENKAANHAKVQALLSRTAIRPGALIVLPEMFATGFSMSVSQIEDSRTEQTLHFLTELAQAHQAYVLAGIVSKSSSGRGRNEAVLINPEGRPIARYQKLHPIPMADEDKHYEPGEKIITFAWHGFTVAPMICYDVRFPEVFRQATKRGTDVFIVIANFPALRESHWIALLIARAIENQAYVIGVNRCGDDPSHHYSGRSLIVDPRGEVIADGGNDESIVTADLDTSDLADYRASFPALKDMRFVPDGR